MNLGPTDSTARGTNEVDSGRITSLAVHPQNPDVVYVGTSGGGVWKSYDFESASSNPRWHPITETLGGLAVGALTLDPNDPEVVYVGLGDAWDVSGNAVFKSTTGGGFWSAPVLLSGEYTWTGGSFTLSPESIRGIRVDPIDSKRVLVATGGGLYRSTDAGATYALVDLPEAGHEGLAESVWSIVYLGSAGGQSAWVASGLQACDVGRAPPKWSGVAAGATPWDSPLPCTFGNGGHLWRSSDSGATWVSLRDSGALPDLDLGRMTVAAGKAFDPLVTAVYVMVGSTTDDRTAGVWRSLDGARSFAWASGTLTNPGDATECDDWPNVAHDQSWYNQALAVDPTNDDRVLIGGNLCGARTLNGTAASPSWENVSAWSTAYGELLPYVHADWQTALIAITGGKLRAFVGGDGGLFTATTVFSATARQVDWRSRNHGLASHLCYSVGSGDPANGNPYPVLTGMQDNGSRMRDFPRWEPSRGYEAGDLVTSIADNGHLFRCVAPGTSAAAEPSWSTTPGAQAVDGTVTWAEAGPMRATTFNEVTGGDGFGTAVNKGTSGEWLWASVQYTRYFCRPGQSNCNRASSWVERDPQPASGDQMPFMTWIVPIQSDDTGAGFLTVTERALWKTSLSCGGAPAPCWVQVGAQLPGPIRQLSAAPATPGLYGVALTDGTFAVTSDEATWSVSSPLGGSAPASRIGFAASIAFPPAVPAGAAPGDVYAVGSSAGLTQGGAPVQSRVFATADRGLTFVSIQGNGSGKDLPA
ncbi:MAG: WD40/YVTN/BNR-like repeat-containing protein, partial [Myxococcaceae bacterium]